MLKNQVRGRQHCQPAQQPGQFLRVSSTLSTSSTTRSVLQGVVNIVNLLKNQVSSSGVVIIVNLLKNQASSSGGRHYCQPPQKPGQFFRGRHYCQPPQKPGQFFRGRHHRQPPQKPVQIFRLFLDGSSNLLRPVTLVLVFPKRWAGFRSRSSFYRSSSQMDYPYCWGVNIKNVG